MDEVRKTPISFSKVLFTGVFILLVWGMLGFAWKIFAYYRSFQSGELVPLGTYQSTEATSDRLAALARSGKGSGELATPDDPMFGSATAPITIVAFTDFGCPYSQEESYVLEALTRNTGDNVRIIMRDFPLTDLHPGADKAAVAAECASEQGKYSEMYGILNTSTGAFTDEYLLQSARTAGLNESEYLACVSSGFYAEEVLGDIADGIAAGVTSTPTLFINGVKIEGAVPYGILYEAILSLAE